MIPRAWTKAACCEAADLGVFRNRRVQLIDGQVLDFDRPTPRHFVTRDLATEVLRGVFGEGYWVRGQGSLDVDPSSESEPDVSVVAGRRGDYTAHPTAADAVLVVEVSDTTLAYDTGDKASLYARAGVADYWVVDLVHGLLEVRRNPVADPSAPFGFRYAATVPLLRGQNVSPLAVPSAVIPVSVLMG